MSDFYLHWGDAEAGDTPFQQIELVHCPRVGEEIWFVLRDTETKEPMAEIVAEVHGILHVAKGDYHDAHVELHMTEVSRTNVESDPDHGHEPTSDKNYEELASLIENARPESARRLLETALKGFRVKEKRFGGVGMAPRVRM